jgi:LysR family hydrogen peroxide-inducible transcriptional activator
MRPTLRQLEYLVAVADTRNFHRAAERVLVSQPGLSAQVRELERTLGVTLFERDRRRVLVTDAGREAAARARRVLALVDDLVDAATGRREVLTGPLRLGVIPSVAPYLLPRALARVRREHPRLRVRLDEDQTTPLLGKLADGHLDLLLLALEAELGDVATRPLGRDPFVLAVPSGHRLAARRAVRPGDLEGEPVLLLEDGH